MHSGSKGRFQSRLFNFAHQQTRRLGEQFGRTVRNLQVATTWSLEALIYPVYLLWQKAMESAGKQLHAVEKQPVKKDQTEILPEIDRLLTKLTGDVTEQAPTLPQQTKLDEIKEEEIQNPNQILILLDAAVASVEENTLAPVSRLTLAVQKKSSSLFQVVQTKLNIFLYGKQSVGESENQSFSIQILIWAALNFFFGDRYAKKLQNIPAVTISGKNTSRKRLPLPPSIPLLNSHQLQDDVTDPWLTSGDLFGDESETELRQKVTDHTNPTLSEAPSKVTNHTNPALQEAPSAKYFHHHWLNWIKNYLKFFQPKATLATRQKSSSELIQTPLTSQKIVIAKQITSLISQFRSNDTRKVEAKPDYLETKAKTIGYEKHPLEQILEWLDHAMLWIEEMFVKIFQRLQRLWLGK